MGRRHAKHGIGELELPRGLLTRLQTIMAEKPISRIALSKQAGLGETYISDLLMGKNSNPSIPALISIAKVLETTVASLLGETYDAKDEDDLRVANLIPLVGIVESGTLRKVPEGDFELVSRPKSEQYPTAKSFVLYVNDNSMAAARERPILPSMEVLCIDIEDADLDVESGKIYAIRRSRNGKEYETILRRAKVFRDHVELRAESGRPGDEEDKIIHKGRLTSDRTEPMYAFGLVYGTFQSFE